MQWKKQAALVLAVCVLAQAVPFWALAEGEPLPGDEGQVCLCQALCTQEEQNGDCPVCGVPGADLSLCQGQPAHEEEQQPTPTPAEAQEPQPEAGLLSAPQPRAGVTKEVRYLDGDGSEKTQTATLLDGSESELTAGWYLAEGEVEFTQRPTVTGDVHLILADGCSLAAPQGITVTDEDDDVENGSPNSLTIYGQQAGTGALTATAAADTGNAGIGGLAGRDNIAHGGAVTIHGGVITATGGSSSGSSGAGIGGAGGGKGGSVTVTGGLVSAAGGKATYNNSAGVGGGGHADGGSVTVTGGQLTATGNTVGIGGGTFGGGLQGSGSFSLSGSGVVFATLIQDKSGESSWQGLVFAGGEGFVYGDSLTLAQSLTIPQGSTLYIPQGSTLTVPELINEGILFNFGTLNAGSLENTGKLYSMQELAGATPISLQSAQYLDENGRTQTRADLIPLNGDMNSWLSGWYLVTGEVTLTQRVQVKGDVHLILADGCSLTAQRGINLLEGNSLTIYGQQEGTGALTATGYLNENSGIGGRFNESNSGAFTLNGGFVTARGGSYAAGIGGVGSTTGGGTITLNGGHLVAEGGRQYNNILNGAGIGGTGLNVVFNGGYVEATGSVGGSTAGSFTTGPDCDGVLVVKESGITDTTQQAGWKGIIFQGNSGKLYGDSFTVDLDWAVPSGATLTIDPGQSLTLGQGTSFGNGGTIQNEGTLDVSGALVTAGGTVSGSGSLAKGSQAAPAAGEGYTLDYTAETLNASSGFEAAADSAASAGSASLALTPGSSPYTVWVRRAENALASASGWTAVTIPARPAAPAVPKVQEKTDTIIRLEWSYGLDYRLEYSLDGIQWESYGSFWGLDPGRTYTIQARKMATDSSFSSLPASRQVTTLNGDGSGMVQSGETAWVNGNTIQNSGSTVIMNGSVRVTLTPAPSGGAAFDAAGQVSLPDGTQVTVGAGAPVTISGSGATVDFDGRITLPGGSSATVDTGEGAVTVTPPAGGGTFTPGSDGSLSLPDGSAAENGGTQITVNGDGSTLTPEGGIQLPDGGSATVDTGKDTVIVTPPAGGGTLTPGSDGSLGLPGGSSLQDGEGTITLPDQGGLLKPDGSVSYSVTLTFDSQGGSQVAGQTLEVGSLAKAPANPAREGYTFTGWYRDAACTQLWDFAAMPVKANLTLYASWQPVEQGGDQDGSGDSGSGSGSGSSGSGSEDSGAGAASTAVTTAGSAPVTGDPFRLGLWLAMLACSLLTLGITARRRD